MPQTQRVRRDPLRPVGFIADGRIEAAGPVTGLDRRIDKRARSCVEFAPYAPGNCPVGQPSVGGGYGPRNNRAGRHAIHDYWLRRTRRGRRVERYVGEIFDERKKRRGRAARAIVDDADTRNGKRIAVTRVRLAVLCNPNARGQPQAVRRVNRHIAE